MKTFFDSDFEVFWTLQLTRWLWILGVLFLWFFVPLGLAMNPDIEAFDLISRLPIVILATVMWRVFLECGIAVLRIAEDLRDLNRKTPEPDQEK